MYFFGSVLVKPLVTQGLAQLFFYCGKIKRYSNSQLKGKLYRLYDGMGLHLAISDKGTKTWFYCYTHRSKKPT